MAKAKQAKKKDPPGSHHKKFLHIYSTSTSHCKSVFEPEMKAKLYPYLQCMQLILKFIKLIPVPNISISNMYHRHTSLYHQ